MAKMKIEVLAARRKSHGLSRRDRIVANLPRYAPLASGVPWLMNLRDRVPLLARLSEAMLGFSAKRPLPRWRRDVFAPTEASAGPPGGSEVVLFSDTFNSNFERENLDAAVAVLTGAGYRVHFPRSANGRARRLCCGRTYLAAGMVEEARAELGRTHAALAPFIERGVPVVGLEPSCLYTFRDEALALDAGAESKRLSEQVFLFEEFLASEIDAGRFAPRLAPLAGKALLHGHCHQKSFDGMGAVQKVLRTVPGLDVSTVESSCCGMAGAFGYQAETIDVSLAMAELSLLPAVRSASEGTLIVADGTSCRQQISHGAGRQAVHVARVLAQSMAAAQDC
jgi:Fe-S oxidoreductase